MVNAITRTIKKILGISLILFLSILVYAILLFELIFIIEMAVLIVHMINQDIFGAYLFIVCSLIINLVMIKHVRKNLQKKTWYMIKSDTFTYTVEESKTNPKIFNVITFHVAYKIANRNYTKIFRTSLKKEKIVDFQKIIRKKIDQESVRMAFYSNPNSENEISLQNGFTISNLLWLLTLLPTHVLIYISSIYMIYLGNNPNSSFKLVSHFFSGGNFTLTLNIINQMPIKYLMIVNFLLIFLYCLLIIYGIKNSGLHLFRMYPLFINQGNTTFDLISQLRKMVGLCSSCGEIIEKNEQYCSNCGLAILEGKFHNKSLV